MKLRVKIKCTIVAEGKTKKEPTFDIQKIGPYQIEFPLSEVRAFSDSDIHYIIDSIPEYEDMMAGIKRYMTSLEGNKADVLDRIKSKSKRFMDIDVLSLRFKLQTKLKHSIVYDETFPEEFSDPYITNILYYDPSDNNLN